MSAVRRLISFGRTFWRWADLDASDLHYYPGVLLVSCGLALAGLPFGFGAASGLVALGIGLIYPTTRRREEGEDGR
jgi:hypothetical protein